MANKLKTSGHLDVEYAVSLVGDLVEGVLPFNLTPIVKELNGSNVENELNNMLRDIDIVSSIDLSGQFKKIYDSVSASDKHIAEIVKSNSNNNLNVLNEYVKYHEALQGRIDADTVGFISGENKSPGHKLIDLQRSLLEKNIDYQKYTEEVDILRDEKKIDSNKHTQSIAFGYKASLLMESIRGAEDALKHNSEKPVPGLEKLEEAAQSAGDALQSAGGALEPFKAEVAKKTGSTSAVNGFTTPPDNSFSSQTIGVFTNEEITPSPVAAPDRKTLEDTRKTTEGMSQAFSNYANSAMDASKNLEGFVIGSMDRINGMFKITTQGLQIDWQNAMLGMANDMLQILMKQFVTGPLMKGLGSLIGGFGGGFSTGISGNILNPVDMVLAQGGAFAADTGLSSYRNRVVTSPTLFAYAKGGIPRIGLMGEKQGSPGEAIMPLTRTSRGDLGVYAAGSGQTALNMDVHIHNNGSNEVRAEQSADPAGGLRLDVFIDEIDRSLAGRVAGGRSALGAALDRTRGLSNAPQLYRK